MGEIAISLNNVSKCYKRYAHPVDRLKEILFAGKSYAQEFWALRDINLEVLKGQTLGILGRNGAGKSTLLQIIVGILTPTTGEVHINGRISALLELGSGFNPEFTGRQNVFFNGRLLGLSQEEIETKFDDIAAFADIGDFLEQPVKTYSSGMFVRLAFAVAANCNPQILIVDEALSVGDIFFQQKCYKFLENIKSSGTAIIFVSHDIQAVLKFCEKAVLLEHGYLKYSGLPSEVASKYTEMYYSQFIKDESVKPKTNQVQVNEEVTSTALTVNADSGLVLPKEFKYNFPDSSRYGCAVGLIAGVSITDTDGKPKSVFQVSEEVLVSVKINQHPSDICPLNIGFQIKDRLGQIIIGTNTCYSMIVMNKAEFGKPFICQFRFNLGVYPQQYTVNAAVGEHVYEVKVIHDWIEDVGVIDVVSSGLLNQIGLCFSDIIVTTNQTL